MKKNNFLLICLIFAVLALTSCGRTGNEPQLAEINGAVIQEASPPEVSPPEAPPVQTNEVTAPETPQEPPTPEQVPVPIDMPPFTGFPLTHQAEDGNLVNGTRISSRRSGYTGTGYVAGFEQEGAAVEFTVYIHYEGFYDLNFITASPYGFKANRIYLNGERIGVVEIDETTDFSDSVLQRVFLPAGRHIIAYSHYWGWMFLDRLEITPAIDLDPAMFNVSARLANPNANEAARQLMELLVYLYGTHFISGQYTDYGVHGAEFQVIRDITGQTPALMGLDLMDYTPSRVARGTVGRTVEHAIEFHNMGGIVTFCWHWNAPEEYITGTWYRAFFTYVTNIDLRKIVDGDDPQGFDLLMRDIDAISYQLLRLQEAGVPVLWRPLHEAAGGWFWWGAAGAEAQIELWRLMFDRMTNYHGLNNLIWLWNGEHADWYPGDAYVDIIGEDVYFGERVYASGIERFLQAKAFTYPPKMVVLSETDALFDPDIALRDGAMWGFFAPWKREFVLESRFPPVYSERFTERWMLEHVYAHERVITLENLLERFPERVRVLN